ncbi:MAG: hypothetical protein WA110_09455 [Anaerolineaceae bacterium]
MKQPEKWRETIDPFSIQYKDFTLQEVLGYPHAGNDVFYVKGRYKQEEVTAFLKVERQSGARLTSSRRNDPAEKGHKRSHIQKNCPAF